MDERLLQVRIPAKMNPGLGFKNKSKKEAEAFAYAFIAGSMKGTRAGSAEETLARKAVVLEYSREKQLGRSRRRSSKRRSQGGKPLSAGEKRRLKVFDIKPEHQRYELFLPLHDLWKQYIMSICNGLRPGSNPQLVQQKLLKADFHGAILTVVRSKCPSYVGTTGILVQEFKHIFKIITKEDRLKVIPKNNSVFAVEVNGFVSHIYGSKFEYRASERSAKKFKVKGSIDL